MDIVKWLTVEPAEQSGQFCEVLRLVQIVTWDDPIKGPNLQGMVIDEIIGRETVERLLRDMGDLEGLEMIRSSMPLRSTVRKGDFGEVVATRVHQALLNLEVPVSKLRFKVTGDSTLHGTDLLSLKMGPENDVIGFVLSEVKTRTKRGGVRTSILEARSQLTSAFSQVDLSIATFVMLRLPDEKLYLSGPLGKYIKSRSTNNNDDFSIFVLFEEGQWHHGVLDEIEQIGKLERPLTIITLELAGIDTLIESAFGWTGLELIDDLDPDQEVGDEKVGLDGL